MKNKKKYYFKKKVTLYISLILMFFSNPAYAAFDVDGNNATYDSNTGILTISDSKFKNSDYTANLSKMKLGNIAITGTYEFKSGILKVYIRNKNTINEQGFNENKTIPNALYMEKGAILYTYRPPNSINVVIESPSNARSLNVNVIGLKPKIIVDRFFTDVSSLPDSGGNITLSITGDNLDKGTFKVRENNTSKSYNLNVTKTSGYVNIKIPENNSGANSVYNFSLYINDVETDKKVNITVLPANTGGSSNQPSNNSSNQETNSKPNNQAPSSKPNNEKPNNQEPIANVPSTSESDKKEEPQDNNISENVIENNKDDIKKENEDNKTTIGNKFNINIIYLILSVLVLISIGVSMLIIKRKNIVKK